MPEVLAVLAVSASVLLALGSLLGDAGFVRARRRPVPVPAGRPLEDIAADVRRISRRFHQQGMRFAQYEGRRRSYDQALAEAADALEIAHLVGVLPAGVELDRERERVEDLLTEVGVLPRWV